MSTIAKEVAMTAIKDKMAAELPKMSAEIHDLVKQYGDVKISDVTIAQAYGGMRGVKGLVCDTSDVPPDKGLIIRGRPVADLVNNTPEEVFWLLLTGEMPTKEQVADLDRDLKSRSKVPEYVWKVLEAMPKDSHPMAMFDTAILVMEKESKFRAHYDAGMPKSDYWVWTLEDALDIVAKLPEIAAGVYRMRFNKGPRIAFDPKLDWSQNYVKMLGLPDPTGKFADCMRLYLVLHSDHESGNVSAHTTFCVNSALSDLYYSLSAGLNGLAGPLHGLANQECLHWVLMVKEKFGGVPTDQQLKEFAWETLNSGKVVPGYGHAVLRITDPRFSAFLEWGKKNIPDDEVFQLVAKVFDVVPTVLQQVQKIKDPWPNVDAGSGALLYHYGMTEFAYYTVLFSVSRALGVCAQAVVARGLGWPIERPKSVTTKWLKSQIK